MLSFFYASCQLGTCWDYFFQISGSTVTASFFVGLLSKPRESLLQTRPLLCKNGDAAHSDAVPRNIETPYISTISRAILNARKHRETQNARDMLGLWGADWFFKSQPLLPLFLRGLRQDVGCRIQDGRVWSVSSGRLERSISGTLV